MKAAIYCRLSEEDRNKQFTGDDSNSIQNQKAMLLQFAKEQGWELYNVYSDDDYTGADRRRPEFNRLLADAEQHRFDIVLCKTQSRFTRELELVEKYIHGLFPVWGIRFISIVDNADTANKGNKKSRQINGLVNEWYLEDMSENIRSVLNNRRENGFHIGAFALYGYRKDPEQKGHLLVDEEAAAVVREVFKLFAKGYGKTAIARMLNDRRIPNPTEYKRLHGLRYRQSNQINSTLWKYFAISDMLQNEIYIGNMVQGKYGSISYKTKKNKPKPRREWYVVEETHEPIIDRSLWDEVQALLRQRSKPFDTGTIGLFAGKARCAYCGGIMRSSKSHNRRYLQCANRHVAKDTCIGSFISVDQLEKLVVEELNRLAKEHLDQVELKNNLPVEDCLQEQTEYLLSVLTGYEKEIAGYTKGIRELYLDKVKGLISEKDYSDMSKEFTTERDRLNILSEKVRLHMAEIEAKAAKTTADSNNGEPVVQSVYLDHLEREIVQLMIASISVSKRIPGTRDVPIEIHWRF